MLATKQLPYALSADDILLCPGSRVGILKSRSEAKINPFIYSAPMDTVTGYQLTKAMLEAGQFPVVSRFLAADEFEATVLEFGFNENCFIAIGSKKEEIAKLFELLNRIIKEDQRVNLALDVAHGDTEHIHEVTNWLRQQPFVRHIMSGSIMTSDAAYRAVNAGCTHLRIGVGPGAACTTRLQTGCGVPQLQAVMDIADMSPGYSQPILIADGGIRYPGDAVKYLAAGAHAVMMGSVFSKTHESPGWVSQWPKPSKTSDLTFNPYAPWKPKLVKRYRGQASAEFQQDIYGKANACPEGAASPEFEWQGETVKSVVDKFYGGLASAISYLGLNSSESLRKGVIYFNLISPAGLQEGKSYGT